MKKRNLQIMSIIALLFFVAVIGVLPATAADVSVIRGLPDEPVYPEDEISVTLTQSGFFMNVGTTSELLPEGFTYRGLASESGGALRDYDEATNTLTIDFDGVATVTYLLSAGTAEQIESATFSGTWKTTDATLHKLSGDIEGDTSLTLGVGPKPTPTPTPTPTPAPGNGGGGNGGGTTPTSTPTVTPTPTPATSPGETPTASPGATAIPSGTPTASPTTTTPLPTTTPTSKPFIPGFEAVFALAGLLAVAYVLIRR